MAISTNLKYFRKEQANNLDVEIVCQRCVRGFTLIRFAIVVHAFEFMAKLKINCSMSREDVDITSRTHTSLSVNFFGLQNVAFITSKCLLEFSSTSDYSQYCGYTTPKLSMTSRARNPPCNSIARQSIAPTT
jgi:hypothetical protein